MSEQNWGCLDKMSEVNFSPAETLGMNKKNSRLTLYANPDPQLKAKVCARITGYPLVLACPGKSVVRWTDRPAMTIAVDLGRKATKPTNQPTPDPKAHRLAERKSLSVYAFLIAFVGMVR